MQKENLMETVVSVVAPAPVETPASGLAAVSDRSVPAVCAKTVTRLDALKEYVHGYMDTERYRTAENRPNDAPVVLDESEQVLSDLRRIAGRAGLENDIAERERAAAFLEFPDSDAEPLTPSLRTARKLSRVWTRSASVCPTAWARRRPDRFWKTCATSPNTRGWKTKSPCGKKPRNSRRSPARPPLSRATAAVPDSVPGRRLRFRD